MICGERLGLRPTGFMACVVAVSWLGCSAPIESLNGSSDGNRDSAEQVSSLASRLVDTDHPAAPLDTDDSEPPPDPSGPHPIYYGGPVVSRAEIVAVSWTKEVTSRALLPRFYSTLTHSGYFRWLREYSTDTQRIHPAEFVGHFVDEDAPTGDTISDEDIRAELLHFLRSRRCGQTNVNSVFAIHFPPGVTVTRGTRRSCFNFCGYHSSFLVEGSPVRYTVVPDLTTCAGRCGGLSARDDAFSVASHEVIETITDPDVALADGLQPPVAWYDPNYGEVADICSFQTDTIGGFVVQEAWSNRANACVSGVEQPNHNDASDDASTSQGS